MQRTSDRILTTHTGSLPSPIVGRENMIAGSDCGFGAFARPNPVVEPAIVWARLDAVADGARRASRALWP
jgi:5-methyltetrahydropteroyltriglutamate--homocysteine methyltransferase